MLREEWEDCTKCALGERREAVSGGFVFGEGIERGIMFIGEGPGKDEENHGRPFVGKSGQLLRSAIAKLGLDRYYLSNTVACRSCGQAHDSEGNPMYWKDRRTGASVPRIVDQAPFPVQAAACAPRLYEEIYLVDPMLIVALGGGAATALARKSVSILENSGVTRTITIPGAGRRPVLTEKRKLWARKVRGEMVTPVEQTPVEYLMMPIVHPAYVLRKQADVRAGNPLQVFVESMKKAAYIYDRYMHEVYGHHPAERDITEADVLATMED